MFGSASLSPVGYRVRQLSTAVLLLLLTVTATTSAAESLWYTAPGADWESESLPIGNGFLGASVLGGVQQERIVIAEKTLWTGGPGSKEGYVTGLPKNPEQYAKALAQIQKTLLRTGKMAPEAVAEKLGHEPGGYGSYQRFADLIVDTDHEFSQISNYTRTLNFESGTATVQYDYQGATYYREYFVSYPDQALAVRLHASKPKRMQLEISLDIPDNRSVNWGGSENRIAVSGALADNNLQYVANLEVVTHNGKVSRQQNKIIVSDASDVTMFFFAATNYENHYPDYRGESAQRNLKNIIASFSGDYEKVKKRHIEDQSELYRRVNLDLDAEIPDVPTDTLLARYQHGNASAESTRALEALYYQYGRYLLIASSRPGSLPANLQGVWNKHEHAPWNSDYHFNINLQMNYWLADMTNLSETNIPLFDYVESLIPPGQEAAKAIMGANGWTVFLNSNIWGFSGTIAWPTAFWQPEAGAWISQHFYQHYLFTQDNNFLKNRAWPVMREATAFWLDALVKDPNSDTWVVVPSFSPEHGTFAVAAAMSQQIVSDLLRNTLTVAEQLNEKTWVEKITPVLDKLEPGLKIGKWGQLQEWRKDLDDRKSHHRHISQLYALYPGNQISPAQTPELAEAAKVTLNARGDGGTGWSKAWKINFWARLFDGDRAHKLLQEQLAHSTLKNLWDNHPPFQIDGNFGATAGMTEMLLQSHLDNLHFLPALPASWPAGQVTGLKARGNILVDMRWQDARLQQATISSVSDQQITLYHGDMRDGFQVLDSAGTLIKTKLQGNTTTFSAQGGKKYVVTPHAR
ncbi:glycoside hydrolase family 95 protein [Alteromonas pelagimontana]|uniref:Glycoside hydrolase family 95 protein n=1 Tax=Alteromonas pelagimontana TaxID=1858656 RepID=A0A6M4MH25_9ALTE|nr:glycoside hydrolase family 95 protein [Alteromonas pelagimontana]QJR82277.1 glycoside hydrolase family 95 protein [Alteromonas pelagimontana]